MPPILGSPITDVYFVMEFMQTDMHRVIYSDNVLSEDHIRFFLWQLLRGLKFIHSANVVCV